MSYGRSKAPLALMEQIIMILVFALASAVCLQAFVYSNQLSKSGEKAQAASTGAQMVAEYCKAEHGNLEVVAQKVNGTLAGDTLTVHDDENDLQIVLKKTETMDYMEKAQIVVSDDTNPQIFSLDIAWQKEGD